MTLSLPTVDVKEKDPAAQLRGSAMWLIAAFAVVGAAQVASLSLTNLSSIAGNAVAVTQAYVGFTISMVGIGIALLNAASVLRPVYYNESALTNDIHYIGDMESTFSFGGARTLRGLVGRRDEVLEKLRQGGLDASEPGLVAENARLKEMLNNWAERRKLELLEERFNLASWWIKIGVCLALIGIILYSSAFAGDTDTKLATRINALDTREEKLAAEAKRLSERTTKLDQRELALAQAGEKWIKLTSKDASAKVIAAREKAVTAREQAVTAAMTALQANSLNNVDLGPARVIGTWTPATALGSCKARVPVKVLLQKVERLSSGVPQATVLTLGEQCPGETVQVSDGKNGSVNFSSSAWKLP